MPEGTINPQIVEVEIGVRTLRKIQIYPLSIADQTKLSGIITEAIQQFVESGEDKRDVEFVASTLNLIKDHLETILKLITDWKTKLLTEITNEQAITIAEIVYEINYEALQKKVTSLIKMMGPTISALSNVVPDSSEDILNTGSEISTESPGETED